MIKRWLGNILVFLLVIILFLIASEVSIRIFIPQRGKRASRLATFPKGAFIPDEKFGLKFSPNFSGKINKDEFNMSFRINSLGLRDKDYGPKQKDVFRIFCLGDSMVFGYGVNQEESLSRYLCVDLQDILKRKIEVINGGIPGYDIDRYPLVLKDIGLKYQPDILILFFTVINDFGEIQRKGQGLIIDNRISDKFNLRAIIGKWKVYLYKHSHLYAWIKGRLDRASSLSLFLIKMGVRNAGDIYLREYSNSMQAKVERAKLAFEEIKEIAKQNNFDLLVVSIPDRIQLVNNLRLNQKYWDIDKPNKVLNQLTQDLSLKYFDLLPLFRANNGERFYYKIDGHLNKEGHCQLAVLVANYLVDKHLIDKKIGG